MPEGLRRSPPHQTQLVPGLAELVEILSLRKRVDLCWTIPVLTAVDASLRESAKVDNSLPRG